MPTRTVRYREVHPFLHPAGFKHWLADIRAKKATATPARLKPLAESTASVLRAGQHVGHQGERGGFGNVGGGELAGDLAGLHALAENVACGGLTDDGGILQANRGRLDVGHRVE